MDEDEESSAVLIEEFRQVLKVGWRSQVITLLLKVSHDVPKRQAAEIATFI